jgi:hypothetical protein
MSIHFFGANYTESLGKLESGAKAGRLLNWLRHCVADEVAKAGDDYKLLHTYSIAEIWSQLSRSADALISCQVWVHMSTNPHVKSRQ